MAKFNLSEAAKNILEGSKETFDANIASKRGGRVTGGQVGSDKVAGAVAYGSKEAGLVGQSPEKSSENLPDYLKGTPQATPPGATPPVGAQPDGVGASRPKGQPQETEGRGDLREPVRADATDYESIRDRKPAKMPTNTFSMNKGATFQHYDGTTTAGSQSVGTNPGGANEQYAADGSSLSEEQMEQLRSRIQEDMKALFDGEELSEEFVNKATTIFEAAVVARSQEIVEQVQAELVEQFDAAVEEIKEDLATKVDDYLNYMVEEWVKENELAIEKGLRSEIVEDFIDGLRNLFVEHYIDIPKDKVDVVEELTNKVEELESTLDEQIKVSVEMKKELNEHKKIEAIYTACEGLTQTQVEKMKSLAEGVDFISEEDFAQKLDTLKTSYFKSGVVAADSSALDDEVVIEEDQKKTGRSDDPLMEAYVKTITQTLKQ